ncbi:hypothetical protein [Clostridium paraputrificum]|uniref:hypothetical protein n=1 Tax=Clostridium paraputrificum TaxID=29363 RepID=UPI00189F35D2|nr:hypothetical protein [Clostridium paraputrificum]MDB2117134.1 hypothetical protein [Clostridium paraputrificum]
MDKYELIDIDEESLADVTLSNEQKENLKNSLNFTLNWCFVNNTDLDIDFSPSNIYSTYLSLGPERDCTIHLIKNAKVLQKIVISAFNKKFTPKNEQVLSSKFLNIGAGMEFNDVAPYWGETLFYHQMYITPKNIYLYSFSNTFKTINEQIIPIEKIETVYLSNSYKDNMKFSNVNLVIQLKDTPSSSNKLYFVSDNPKDHKDIQDILSTLLSLNVPNTIPKRKTLSKLMLFIIIMFIIFTLFTTLGLLGSI